MAKPLTKTTKEGTLYTRPPKVEAEIDVALTQDFETIRRRAHESDHRSRDYLTSECLVHLIRQAIRCQDEATQNALLPILLARCEANLERKIPGTVRNAELLRDEVLGALGEVFAEDAGDPSSEELDYFECRFAKAFAALRCDVLKKEKRLSKGRISLDGAVRPGEEDDGQLDLVPACRATQEDNLLQEELLSKLPEDERRAFVLCEVMGYDVESADPEKTTAATLCNVSGRTIRTRLKQARERLARITEDAR